MKCLFVRNSSLGDVVVATSALTMAKEAGHEVHLVTYSEFTGLFDQSGPFDKLWSLDRGRGLKGVRTLGEDLKREGFDLGFDLHGKPLSRAILRSCGAARRVVVPKRALSRRMHLWFRLPIERLHNIWLYYEHIGRALGFRGKRPPFPRLEPLPLPLKLPEHTVSICPGAQHASKRWPLTRFTELAYELEERGFVPMFLGSASEAERFGEHLEERWSVLMGRTTLAQAVSLIAGSVLTVANDSGLAHVSAATGTPVVVIYGPTVREFGLEPLGRHVAVLEQKLWCRPCSLHGEGNCFRRERLCMTRTRVKDVMRLATDIARRES